MQLLAQRRAIDAERRGPLALIAAVPCKHFAEQRRFDLMQHERMQGLFLPSMREYFTLFGLTAARLAHAAPDVIVMHPGPMNRGVEIDSEVADGPWSVILDQVANGVAVRMAVLYLLAGGEGGEP